MHIFRAQWWNSRCVGICTCSMRTALPSCNHIDSFMSLQRSVNIEHKRHGINIFTTRSMLQSLSPYLWPLPLSHITLYSHLHYPLAVSILLLPLFNGSKWKKNEEELFSNNSHSSVRLSACLRFFLHSRVLRVKYNGNKHVNYKIWLSSVF